MKKTFVSLSILTLAACLIPGAKLQADPPPITDLSAIFCLRITEIQQDFGNTDSATFTFEILNWADAPAYGLYMAQADTVVGSPGINPLTPVITSIAINPIGGNIGGGIASGPEAPDGIGPLGNPGEHHSGRGKDVMGFENDWVAESFSPTSAAWNGTGATAVPNRDLVAAYNSGGGNNLAAAQALVPGFGFDQLGDSAVDGGPGPYFAGVVGEAGEPMPFGSGNVLDGFQITIDNFNVGEVIALNWFLLDAGGAPLGTAAGGNTFGFGVLNLFSVSGEFPQGEAPEGGGLPGPVFVGNTGANQNTELFGAQPFSFFTEFAGELGGGITAPFLNPADNIFSAPINTSVIPEPSRAILLVIGVLGVVFKRRRR